MLGYKLSMNFIGVVQRDQRVKFSDRSTRKSNELIIKLTAVEPSIETGKRKILAQRMTFETASVRTGAVLPARGSMRP